MIHDCIIEPFIYGLDCDICIDVLIDRVTGRRDL